MVFSSHLFLFYFLPTALFLYYIGRGQARHVVLTLVSYVFYGWGHPAFCWLLLGSTLIDYWCGRVMTTHPHRKRWALRVSILTNLGMLALFKYGTFGIENWNAFIGLLGLQDTLLLPVLHITLPLGISFYTFQSMSYTIDVYRGEARCVRRFSDFACYVSMFPQLVAGPIVRYQTVADQLVGRTHTLAKAERGIAFFIIGLAQKVVLANPCGRIADEAFLEQGRSCLDAWWGIVAYSMQIFFDFAGYSNMAIGLGLLLGFTFPVNFNHPYHARSITDFWRRWHISLSTWLRDYLYIPLGGNRKGAVRTYINLMVVMLLGGLWHGASWNFVIWGLIHGLALAGERLAGGGKGGKALAPARWLFTYVIVLVAWVFFRAGTLHEAFHYLKSMAGMDRVHAPWGRLTDAILYQPYLAGSLLLAAWAAWRMPSAHLFTQQLNSRKWALLAFLSALSLWLLTAQSYNPFIYFIF